MKESQGAGGIHEVGNLLKRLIESFSLGLEALGHAFSALHVSSPLASRTARP